MLTLIHFLHTGALMLVVYAGLLAMKRQHGSMAVYALGTVMWGMASLFQYFSILDVVLVVIGSVVLAVQLISFDQHKERNREVPL